METPWRNCLNVTCNRLVRFGDNFCSSCGRELTNEQKDTLRYAQAINTRSFGGIFLPVALFSIGAWCVLVVVFSSSLDALGPETLRVFGIFSTVVLLVFMLAIIIWLRRREDKKTARYWEAALGDSKSKRLI